MVRLNSEDKTIERNYKNHWRHLIQEYESVKAKKHPTFRFVSDFYRFHKTNRQTFIKYYNRYKSEGSLGLMPRKRGPKYKYRLPLIENKIIEQRQKGLNRYEIRAVLEPKLKHHLPSPSGIYRICRKHGLGKLTVKAKNNKRRIIKENPGELGHIDCHHLSKDIVMNNKKKYYLVCVVDSCTRIAWAEVVDDIKSLSVMFTAMQCFNAIASQYSIRFSEVLTDNGSEFASKNNLDQHPFERMLLEMGVKHRYTRPYRPQTNGKVERFWRTLNEDLIDETTFESIDEFKKELFEYLIYYNEMRPHSALGGITPKKFIDNLSTN